jgi:hypothetical protein
MDEETKWVPCLIRMVRFCQLTCDVQMCLGSGYHFAPWIKIYSVLRERPGTSSTNWRCASRPGFSEPRTHSTSTTATSWTCSGWRWISRNSSSCTGAVELLRLLSRITLPARSGSTDRSAEQLLSARSIGQDRIRPNANSARVDGAEDPR